MENIEFKNLQKDFQNLLGHGRLAHGYIFFGNTSSASEFAHSFICHLEHGDWHLETENFSDLQILDGRREKLGVEQARLCTKFLSLSPLVSKRRAIIIYEANKLTPAAQNAILKITEEPPSQALIILILKDPSVLLETLLSRFQKIYFKGENTGSGDLLEEMRKTAKQFLAAANNKARSEILKTLVKDEKPFDPFVQALVEELSKDKIKNANVLAELLKRWELMNQFNVNKRLQIEAIIRHLN